MKSRPIYEREIPKWRRRKENNKFVFSTFLAARMVSGRIFLLLLAFIFIICVVDVSLEEETTKCNELLDGQYPFLRRRKNIVDIALNLYNF